MDYDPDRISYSQLSRIFWASHDPTARAWSQQYKIAVFVHNEKQRRIAVELLEEKSRETDREIRTEILPYTGFTLAEDYHQKYYLRSEQGLMEDFTGMYPDPADFVKSTAAARVNGYIGGYGTLGELMKEIDSYGLSGRGKKILIDRVSSSGSRRKACPI